MIRKLTALLLSGALLCALCACGPGEKSEEILPPDSQSGSSTSQPQPPVGGEEEVSQPDPIPQPAAPILTWEEEHTLDTDVRPENHGGLELPVRGATGYTSVELGLWEVRPDLMPKTEAKAAPEHPAASASPVSAVVQKAEIPPEAEIPGPPQEPQAQENVSGESSSPEVSVAEDSSSSTGVPPELPADTGDVSQTVVPEPEESKQAGGAVQPEQPVPEPEPESAPDPFQGALAVLEAGTPFTILEEQKDWWRIRCQQGTGWVEHRYCMINLPDVIPSMVYYATNSFSSLYRTSGKEIPHVTGAAFYSGKSYNERLEREEYKMPVLYAMAQKIAQAQRAALEEGNTLVLYEGYRPYRTQKAVRDAVSKMAGEDPEVKAGVSTSPWSQTWFISNGYSNHQKGFAIDVSLGKVWETEVRHCGKYTYLNVTDYTLYEMPTQMHELSLTAATFTAPVSVNSATAWKSAQLSPSMNEPALGLQRYCTGAGLTPLASEWWHFNDLEARKSVAECFGSGGFEITVCMSKVP